MVKNERNGKETEAASHKQTVPLDFRGQSMNPYEPPQTIDSPLPPAVEQTHLEQVSFRQLSEIAWSLALPGQIMIVALLTALVLVGVVWQFYLPIKNPIWVTILMLGCGSILTVLVCWAGIMLLAAGSTFRKNIRHPPYLCKRDNIIQKYFVLGAIYSIPPIVLGLRNQLAGTLLLSLALCFPTTVFWLASKQRALLLTFLRSFLPQAMWRQSGAELQRFSMGSTIFAMICLFMMNLESVPSSIAWGWLMLALMGAISYFLPITYAYRQLAQEFDKLWP